MLLPHWKLLFFSETGLRAIPSGGLNGEICFHWIHVIFGWDIYVLWVIAGWIREITRSDSSISHIILENGTWIYGIAS